MSIGDSIAKVMFGRKRREVQRQVTNYREGRRLMRNGDGGDEWIGMRVTREALVALVKMGRDETGQKVTEEELGKCLRVHGLDWRALEES